MEDTPSGVSTAPPPFGPCWKVRDPLPFLPPSILPPSLFLFSPLSLSLSSLSLSLLFLSLSLCLPPSFHLLVPYSLFRSLRSSSYSFSLLPFTSPLSPPPFHLLPQGQSNSGPVLATGTIQSAIRCSRKHQQNPRKDTKNPNKFINHILGFGLIDFFFFLIKMKKKNQTKQNRNNTNKTK